MKPEVQQALQYLAAAVSDYANSLPPSVKAPFVRECQAALTAIETALNKPQDPPKA